MLWVTLCPSNRYAEVLTSGTCEWNLSWKYSFCRCTQDKTRSYCSRAGPLVQYHWCLYKRRKDTEIQTHKGDMWRWMLYGHKSRMLGASRSWMKQGGILPKRFQRGPQGTCKSFSLPSKRAASHPKLHHKTETGSFPTFSKNVEQLKTQHLQPHTSYSSANPQLESACCFLK